MTDRQDDGHALDWDSPVNEPGDYVPPGDMIKKFAKAVGAIATDDEPEDSKETENKEAEATHKPVLVDMSTVTPTPVRWLWPGRFAKGRLSLLVGRAGLGKSFLTIDMAMRITTGFGWPDGTACPTGTVLFICCEDDPGDTIRPRLDAAGADASKVQLLRGVSSINPQTGKLQESPFTLQDVTAMESALKKMRDCQLVIIDPIGSYLGGGTDSHRDNEVRGVLAPVSALAEKYGPAVVIVAHTRKSTAKYADDTALGSRAFTGIVRTSWHLMADENGPERKLLLPGKNNLAKVAPGLAYKIVTNENYRIGDDGLGVGRLAWESGTIDMHADDALAEANEQGKPGPDSAKQGAAETWLGDLLADGPVSAPEVKSKVKGAPFSFRTVERAKATLGVTSEYIDGSWLWSLPPSADPFGDG